MDDITVVVAKVKKVLVPEDEVDLQKHSIFGTIATPFHLLYNVNMCYFRVVS